MKKIFNDSMSQDSAEIRTVTTATVGSRRRRQWLASVTALCSSAFAAVGCSSDATPGGLQQESVFSQSAALTADDAGADAASVGVGSDAAPPAFPGTPYNCDTGNVALDVIFGYFGSTLLHDISAGANDASLILRMTSEIDTAWFDAIAPYHPTAVGVYSHLGRRPAFESLTNCNKNIAMAYAAKQVMDSVLPAQRAKWITMLSSIGLNPNDTSMDLSTPQGIGNAAGHAVVAMREHDGMNQLGDVGRKYNRHPYWDYTNFTPSNSAYEIRDPSKWQPNIGTNDIGIFFTQQFVTPQYRLTTPIALRNVDSFHAPRPSASMLRGRRGFEEYKAQADAILALSAGLTDMQKAEAELFDNKLRSLGLSSLFVGQVRHFDLDKFIQMAALANIAAFDAGIVAWKEKNQWNAPRPFTAIRYLYGDTKVTAWGGPGKGTVNDITGNEWRSYMPTADHPEYPSGSACFCAAQAQAIREFLHSDALGWDVPVARGSSRIEPGITPAADLTLHYETWTDFEDHCGQARLLAGVHFAPSVAAAKDLCGPIGTEARAFLQEHIAGVASTR